MSKMLEYFPPKPYCDTGWKHKSLNYNPWIKYLVDQHPCRITLYVDLDENGYYFTVDIYDWLGRLLRTPNEYVTSDVEACAKAELLGEKWRQKLFPEWVKTALKNKWRPPFNEKVKFYLAAETFEESEYFSGQES